MLVGIISDTHDNIKNIEKAVDVFIERRVRFVIHAGDYVCPKAVESFQGIKLIGVLGNNDVDVSGLTSAFNNIGGELKGDFCEIELGRYEVCRLSRNQITTETLVDSIWNLRCRSLWSYA